MTTHRMPRQKYFSWIRIVFFLRQVENLQRVVALKVLPDAFLDDPDRVRRFEQEARAAGIETPP